MHLCGNPDMERAMTNSNWKPVAHNPVCLEDDLRYSQCVCDGTRWHEYGERVGDFAGVWALTGWLAGLSEPDPVAWMHPSGGTLQNRATGLERMTYTIPLYAAPVQPAAVADEYPSRGALMIIAESVSAALDRAGFEHVDDPGEAIDILASRASAAVTVPDVQVTTTVDAIDAGDHEFIDALAGRVGPLRGKVEHCLFWRRDGGVIVLWDGPNIGAVALTVRDDFNRTKCLTVNLIDAAVAVPDGCDPEFMAALARGDHLNGLGDPATVARAVAIARQFPFKGEGATRQPSAQAEDFGLPVTQEPKYTTNAQGRLVNRATGVAIPDDEPVFILRAKDRTAMHAIYDYANRLSPNTPHHGAVVRRAHQFDDFKMNHPERIGEPDTAMLAASKGGAE